VSALDAGSADAGTESAKLSESEVVGVIASGNAGEVDDGLFALARAVNEPAVLAFGSRMVTDHSQNQQQLGQLGEKPKESSTSKQLRSEAEKVDAQLSQVAASEYPRAYLDASVEDHTKDLERIDSQLLPSAKSTELKTFLTKLRATISTHLKLAKQLQGQVEQSDAGAADAGASDAGSASDAGAGGTAGSLSDAQIAQAFATANAGEGEQGTIALAHTTNTAVTAFARMLITDHTAAQRTLATVLKTQKLTTENSSTSDKLRKSASKVVEKLVRYNDAKFDQKFAKAEVTVHETVLKLLDQQLIPGAKNAQLRTTLTAARATIARHLAMAQQLVQSSSGADGGTANDGGAYDAGGSRQPKR